MRSGRFVTGSAPELVLKEVTKAQDARLRFLETCGEGMLKLLTIEQVAAVATASLTDNSPD